MVAAAGWRNQVGLSELHRWSILARSPELASAQHSLDGKPLTKVVEPERVKTEHGGL